jgi:hypothetical protein
MVFMEFALDKAGSSVMAGRWCAVEPVEEASVQMASDTLVANLDASTQTAVLVRGQVRCSLDLSLVWKPPCLRRYNRANAIG